MALLLYYSFKNYLAISLMADHLPILTINDKDFQNQVIESHLPVIVVFEKSFWGTAYIMKPIIEKLATDYNNKIKFFKYNLEENTRISDFYRIENSTTILIFNKGNVIHKTGAISKGELNEIIKSFFEDSFSNWTA